MSEHVIPKPPEVPAQCKICTNFNIEDMICKLYDYLPGEGDRKDVKECKSFIDKTNPNDELRLLADYISEDPEGLVEDRITEAVSKVLKDYDVKFKVMVVGIARRKIRAMVKMVDIIDILLNKLTDFDDGTVDSMSPAQIIKLLSELNNSVNNDLSFVMKLIQPDSDLRDLQINIENKTLNLNGATPETEMKAEKILEFTGTSRDKIREAFNAILSNIEIPETSEVYEPTEEELDYLEQLDKEEVDL